MAPHTCSIPEHGWLVIKLDDLLDSYDPIGIVDDRPRAHEYLPEIPDLIALIVAGEVQRDDVVAVFRKFFLLDLEDSTAGMVTDGIRAVRQSWLDLIKRTNEESI